MMSHYNQMQFNDHRFSDKPFLYMGFLINNNGARARIEPTHFVWGKNSLYFYTPTLYPKFFLL